jgi:hypothetical protein
VNRAIRIGLAFVCTSLAFAPRASADERASACADAGEKGQELRDTGQLLEARALFVKCAQRECPTAVRDSCTEWLADVDRRVPSIVVAAKDDRGHDIGAIVVSLDGQRLPGTVTSTAVSVNPGTHTVRVEAEGHEPGFEEIILREGELRRAVSITLRRVNAQRPLGPPKAHIPVLPIALGVTSVALLGTFTYFALSGAGDYRDLERTCAPSCTQNDIDAVRTKFVVADVTLVAGLVVGVAAGVFWFLDRPKPAHIGGRSGERAPRP